MRWEFPFSYCVDPGRIIPLSCFRMHFHRPSDMERMVKSLQVAGMLQPLLLAQIDGEGEPLVLLDGYLRLEAAKQIGLEKVPVHIVKAANCHFKEYDRQWDDAVARKALEANLVRRPVSADVLEKEIMRLHEQGQGYRQIGQHIGYSKAGVQKIMQRLKNRCVGDSNENNLPNFSKQTE